MSIAFNRFYDSQLVKGNQEETIRAYKTHLNQFLYFANDIEIETITYELYCDYILHLRKRKKQLSSVTIHSYANSLKCFLTFLYDNNLIKNNISADIKKLPKQLYKVPRIISAEQMRIIIDDLDLRDKLDSRNALIFVLCFDVGLRLSELVRLHVEDLDFNNKLIRVTGKSNKQRNVPMTDTIEFYLCNYLDFYRYRERGQLLLNVHDKNITKNAIRILFKKTKIKYHLTDFHPHLLRHSFATLYLVNGGDSLTLQDILGHSTLEMTRRYVHLSNSLKMSEQKIFCPLSNTKIIKKETPYINVRSPTKIIYPSHFR